MSKRAQGKAPARANPHLGGRGRNTNAGIMGAKTTAARKGALIPASPKGKAKKKATNEDKDEDSIAETPPAEKDNTDDNNMASDKEDKVDNSGQGDEPQEDQEQAEPESTSSRAADAPKIDISDQAKVRRPLRCISQIKTAMTTILLLLHCDPRFANKNDTNSLFSNSTIHYTKQGANRTWFELALTQTIPNQAHVLKGQTALPFVNT
eukprot:326191-Pleurochrysis_carterae.AAC.1